MIVKIHKSNNFSIVCNEIYKNPLISARAKGIYGYLMTLPEDWKLVLSHLYQQFSEGRDAISKALKELETYGYVKKERISNGDQESGGWEITVFESVGKFRPPTENPQLLSTNSNSINISTPINNNISNNTIASEAKKEIRSIFSSLYESKMKEISGTIAKLPWSGKEAKLLKKDMEIHGLEVLKKYIFIFFSDKDRTIADFTRHRAAAGYSFSVFHGMISKLAMSKVKIESACPHCRGVGKHSPDCKIVLEKIKEENNEKKEINRLKDINKDFSFTNEFNKRIKKGA